MLNTPFSPWPSIAEEEIEAVVAVLRSNRINYWTGTECREFEKEFAAWCGTRHALSLANGTVALELAMKLAGVGPGDEVITTPRTFIASASCIVLAGARVVFADIDIESQNITAQSIAAVLSLRTKAVICVHLAGWPCDMDPINQLTGSRGITVIEDCAQAHGARYKGRPVGGLGHLAAWSFCQDKIMTTGGEGGMLTTNDERLWNRGWSYKDHGKSWSAIHQRGVAPGFRWLHESFGTNWRLTEMQAAIGRRQLLRMAEWSAARARNAERLARAARACAALRVPTGSPDIEPAWYKFYVFVRPEMLRAGWTRDRVMQEINQRGVPCYTGSCPEIYLERAFEESGMRPSSRLPVARELGETSLMFLVHPTLSEQEIDKSCEVLRDVMTEAAR